MHKTTTLLPTTTRQAGATVFASLRTLLTLTALAAMLTACGGGGGGGDGDAGSDNGNDPPPVGGPSDPSTPDPDPAPPPADGEKPMSFFVDTSWHTAHARIAVDAQGGKHLAFAYQEPAIEDRPTSAVYRHCSADCEQATSWKELRWGSLVRSVQLELTTQGKPRLLIAVDSSTYTGGKDYHYASCDAADCTQAEAWSISLVFSGRVPAYNLTNDDELPDRSFELDPQDRPRFVVFDENQLASPQHFGLYYLSCDSQCEQASQWHEALTTIVEPYALERVSQPVLAFSPSGQPRIASAQFTPLGNEPSVLMYLACDADCDQPQNWGRAALAERGGGAEPSVDLEVNAAGQPRIAFYQEAMLEGQGKRLSYMSCDDGCLDASHWQRLDLGLGAFNGQEPDLALDAQGRPRIAYADWDEGGIGYASCDRDCASDASAWQHRLLETRDALYQAWPVAYPAHCTGGLWNTLDPTLALPAQGPAQISFDATYHARCVYDHDPSDNIPPSAEMNLIVKAGRVVTVE